MRHSHQNHKNWHFLALTQYSHLLNNTTINKPNKLIKDTKTIPNSNFIQDPKVIKTIFFKLIEYFGFYVDYDQDYCYDDVAYYDVGG